MGDQHVARVLRRDGGAQQVAVAGIDMQRILAKDRDHIEAERDSKFLEDASDLWLADLEIRLVVEVDLVDGAAGGNDQQIVHAAIVRQNITSAKSGSHQPIGRPSACQNGSSNTP